MTERVLLVEDDPSVARFVAIALEDLPIDLCVCTSVTAALAALHAAPVRLVITDLMLPGESGLSLLQALQDQPALRQHALLVVFSAGINPEIRLKLNTLDVWKILSKPVSVVALEACVCDALQLGVGVGVGVERALASANDGVTPDERQAISTHFAGDAALFRAYKASCLQQFAHDRLTGDRALAAQDAPALRRLAHSLATVLLTLGFREASAVARTLEDSAEQLNPEGMADGWARLRPWLEVVFP